jgi:hypothetical protein
MGKALLAQNGADEETGLKKLADHVIVIIGASSGI